MATKCECESVKRPKTKKRPATKRVVATSTKTNKGCMVKNIIVINGCCSSNKGTARKTVKKKPVRKAAPKTVPVIEKIEVIEPAKKTKKRRSYSSPSPLVEYDSSDRLRKTTPRKKTASTPKKTKKKTVPKTESPKRIPTRTSRKESPSPLIEVVDYDDGYRGSTLERREKPIKAIESPRSSKQTVEVIHIEKEPRKSLRESYKEYKDNRLAKRTEKVGRREESDIIDSTPVYYVEESPKSLPSPSKKEPTILALPSGELPDDLIDVSDCSNLSGKNKVECKKRQKSQRKKSW